MKKFLNLKTLVGGIIVAIIGSALWENIFRNFFNFAGRTLLTISTLGIERYKNDIYVDIAKGFYEQVSIQILELCLSVFLGIIFATIIIYFLKNNLTSLHWLKDDKPYFRTLFIIYSIFVVGVTILNLSRTTYVNRSIAYYKQLASIASPYMTASEEEIFNARFAKIKNSNEYSELINNLKDLVVKNGESLPIAPSFIF